MRQCQISSKSVNPLQRYRDFVIFQDGRRPPSWTWCLRVGATHEEHTIVFIIVQNLIGIDAAVSITCMLFTS